MTIAARRAVTGTRRGVEPLFDLAARLQVLTESVTELTEAAEIDDPRDILRCRRGFPNASASSRSRLA